MDTHLLFLTDEEFKKHKKHHSSETYQSELKELIESKQEDQETSRIYSKVVQKLGFALVDGKLVPKVPQKPKLRLSSTQKALKCKTLTRKERSKSPIKKVTQKNTLPKIPKTERLPLSKKTLKKYLKKTRKAVPGELSTNPSESSKSLSPQKKPKRTLNRPRRESIADFLELMYKNSSEYKLDRANIFKDEKNKALVLKLCQMMKKDPGEMYRIVNNRAQTKTPELKDWTDQNEAVFKSISSHSFNSIAKTKKFEKAKHQITESINTLERQWKYDKHSPWFNDLDSQYSSKNSISNINRVPKPEEETPEQKFTKYLESLREKTGEPEKTSLVALEKKSKHIDKLKMFEDSVAGFHMQRVWKTSKKNFEKAKVALANHIIEETEKQVENVSKQRYSYLSAKVACQRANSELEAKLMEKAEVKRQQLRKRQIQFQRDLTLTRNRVTKLYPDYKLKPRRTLLNTAHALGSPEFRTSMIQLGYLPSSFEARPQAPKTLKVTKDQLHKFNPKSIQNLSGLNFTSKKLQKDKPDTHLAAGKIQGLFKGLLHRKKQTKKLQATQGITWTLSCCLKKAFMRKLKSKHKGKLVRVLY